MEISERHKEAIGILEDAGEHEAQLAAIFGWAGLRPGQRTAAVVICAWTYACGGIYPTVDQLAQMLGITLDRCKALFDDVEHPPYALTRVDHADRFLPTQTLAYGSAD